MASEMKMLPLIIACVLTHPTYAIEMDSNKVVKLDKGQRIQILTVTSETTTFYAKKRHYRINSKELICR